MRSVRPTLVLALALGVVATHQGCVAVVAGAGAGAAVAYVRGDLDGTLEANLETSIRATQRAIEKLKFAKVSEKSDALQAIIIARNAADKKIEIRLEKTGTSLSKLKIRAGVFGDETLSREIYDAIRASL